MSLRILAFPFAGAGPSVYRGWGRGRGEAVVIPVGYAGREERLAEPPWQEWPELLEALGREVEPQCREPFWVYGHSLGAIVAFELLRRHPEWPACGLVAGAAAAPPVWRPRARWSHLGDDALSAALTTSGAVPAEVAAHRQLWALLLPQLRADFTLCDRYRYVPGPPLRCPVLALRGESDEAVDAASSARWGEVTAAGCRSESLPGGHLFLRTHGDEALERILAYAA